MKNLLLIAVAGAALIGCQRETIDPGAEKNELRATEAKNNAKDVVLPPSITATKTYRCKDNSVVHIDWMSDGSARVKGEKDETSTAVKIGEAGTPSLDGSASAPTVTYNKQSCKS